MNQPSDEKRSQPQAIGDVISQLFALRGYCRVQGKRQLHDIWREVAGERISGQTRVSGIQAGVLQVGVSNSALLSELASFHKYSLVDTLRSQHSHLNVKDIKFKLRGDIA